MSSWRLHIEVLEDLHIGTGTGWGDIDALQARDRRNFPVVPASHIKGLWREAAEEWHHLDPEALHQDDIDRLFGRAGSGQGRLQLSSAYLREDAPTLIWGGTRIDNETGTAQEKNLHFIEYVPAGACFTMQIALNHEEEGDAGRLRAIIRRCTALGGKRRRGHGRVRWQMSDEPLGQLQNLLPPTTTTLPVRLRLLLRNLDPVCLARTGYPGNNIASETYLRGRSLRGAITAACLALGRTDWAQTLLDPRLAWGDALPLPVTTLEAAAMDRCEVLPIPLSLGTPKKKAGESELPWWAVADNGGVLGARGEIDQLQQEAHQGKPQEKLKRPDDGELLYRACANEAWQRYQPNVLERLHAAVPSKSNQFQQGLFSTEEIAENTLFLADLILFDAGQAATLNQILQTLGTRWLRVGRGGKPLQIEAARWVPVPVRSSPAADGFTLLLESDLIVRDAFGNDQDRLDVSQLALLAGLPDAKIRSEKNLSEGISLYGFNGMTGLPRQARRAIKAGSAIRIGGEDASKVRAALAAHFVLGDLPEEGFGRFRLDALPTPQILEEAPVQIPQTPIHLQEALCQEAKKWASKNFKKHCLAAPSLSQWGEFRNQVQSARSPADIDNLFEEIKSAAQKHGGKAWKPFIESPEFPVFHKHLQTRTLDEALHLLEYFVRWVRVIVKSREDV